MVVYLIRNTVNGKVYVGKTKEETPTKRWKSHQRSVLKGSSLMLHKAIRKYGIAVFTIEIVAFASTPSELNELEKVFIAQYQSYPPELGKGYNMSPGGDGGAEIRLGKKQSLEAREKVSKYRKLHPIVAGSETACRISQSLKGRTFTPQWSSKKSEAQRGSKNHQFGKRNTANLGKRLPPEWRANLSKAQKERRAREAKERQQK